MFLPYFAIPAVLGAALSAAVGLFTLTRNPRHPANIGFMLGMTSFTVVEAGSAVVLFFQGRPPSETGLSILVAGLAAIPSVWLFFSLVFARSNYREILRRWTPLVACMGLISVFFAVIAFWGEFSGLSYIRLASSSADFASGDHEAIIIGPAGRYLFIYLILGLVINLIHLEITLKASGGQKRWHIKYVIFGVGAVFAFLIYVSSQALLFLYLQEELIPVASVVILLCSSILAIFIARYRLLGVDIFISRYVIYNSLTVLIVGAYLLAVGIIAQGINYFEIPFTRFFEILFIFVSLLALVISLFTTVLRRKIQAFVTRHFYKHKYEFRDKWMETIERISTKRTVREVETTLREMVAETMGAKGVYLWLYDPASKDYRACQQVPGALDHIPVTHPFIEYLREHTWPFLNEDASGGEAAFKLTDTVLCTPLVSDGTAVGFLLQGPDISGEPYREDDFEFLAAVATQSAVQIKNVTLAQELIAAREVEAFSRISTFIMHDLKNLTNSLSLVSQNARFNMDDPEFQKDTIKTIDGTVSRMKSLMGRLSNVSRGAEFKKVRVDLKSFIGKVLAKTVPPADKKIVITTRIDPMPPIYIDSDALEMVFFNIIINAFDAVGKDGIIKVAAAFLDGFVHITVQDNGSGIPRDFIDNGLFMPFKTTKKNGFGIGLYQCKTLIEGHGGNISVESSVGEGTTFTIKLPADAEARQTGLSNGISAR